jgi:hypothetical protein
MRRDDGSGGAGGRRAGWATGRGCTAGLPAAHAAGSRRPCITTASAQAGNRRGMKIWQTHIHSKRDDNVHCVEWMERALGESCVDCPANW